MGESVQFLFCWPTSSLGSHKRQVFRWPLYKVVVWPLKEIAYKVAEVLGCVLDSGVSKAPSGLLEHSLMHFLLPAATLGAVAVVAFLVVKFMQAGDKSPAAAAAAKYGP